EYRPGHHWRHGVAWSRRAARFEAYPAERVRGRVAPRVKWPLSRHPDWRLSPGRERSGPPEWRKAPLRSRLLTSGDYSPLRLSPRHYAGLVAAARTVTINRVMLGHDTAVPQTRTLPE